MGSTLTKKYKGVMCVHRFVAYLHALYSKYLSNRTIMAPSNYLNLANVAELPSELGNYDALIPMFDPYS